MKIMDWEPISEADLWDKINSSCMRMSVKQERLWHSIAIVPEKWKLPQWGDEGGGFWVVAIIGRVVIWFNDIEDGFNRSHYSKYGEITEYRCNQDNLEWTVQHILDEINDGYPSGGYASHPMPIA